METLGDKIYKLRENKHISQEELSFEIGVSRQTIHRWETNLVQPNIENLNALSDFFDVDLNYFLDNEDEAVKSEVSVTVSESRIPHKRKLSIFIAISIFLFLLLTVSAIFTIGSGLIAFSDNRGHEKISTLVVDKPMFFIFLSLTLILSVIEGLTIFYLIKRKSNINVT